MATLTLPARSLSARCQVVKKVVAKKPIKRKVVKKVVARKPVKKVVRKPLKKAYGRRGSSGDTTALKLIPRPRHAENVQNTCLLAQHPKVDSLT